MESYEKDVIECALAMVNAGDGSLEDVKLLQDLRFAVLRYQAKEKAKERLDQLNQLLPALKEQVAFVRDLAFACGRDGIGESSKRYLENCLDILELPLEP